MLGQPRDYWGKLERRDGEVVAWHPLADHCADVAACFEALLERSVVRRRLARLAGLPDLSNAQVARLSVLAALHDIGKFNHGFQAKALAQPSFTCGHVREVAGLFMSPYDERDRLFAALKVDRIGAWASDPETIAQLLVASISHHGKPVAADGAVPLRAWRRQDERDPLVGIANLVDQTEGWFPEAFDTGADPLPSEAPFQHAFSGLVMLADWLGSDTSFFPYSEPADGQRMPRARKAAEQALRYMGLDPASSRQSLGPTPPEFTSVWPFEPRPMQRVLDELRVPPEPSLCILESDTGSGKTEAAIARYLRLFHAGRVDGMYFALPTRTAAIQLHRRVQQAVAAAFPDAEARPPVVLAVPGYLSVDDQQGRRLTGFDVLWNDDDRERFRYRGWAAEHPKRYLAGAVAVGTIDQVLLSAITTGHAHMRAGALLRHLLVVDEVHASDAYMNRLLEEVLRHHLDAGGHALLMSATLGARARESFLSLLADGEGAAFEEAARAPYPWVVQATRSTDPERIEPAPAGYTKEVRARLVPSIRDPEQAAEVALKAARAGARVLVLRNLVRDCVATQGALESAADAYGLPDLLFRCAGRPAPHHSRFAKEDREALDHAIEESFGKNRSSGGVVAVATQTVQQSLDLDADLLITDLCPMDVLLQRIGRLHRHPQRKRPPGFEVAEAVVLVPEMRGALRESIDPSGKAPGPHGLGTVYDDLRILESTWHTLETYPHLRIPEMNRLLVESSTHPDVLANVVREGGEAWARHEQYVLGTSLADRRVADHSLVEWDRPFGTYVFPSAQLEERVKTRLGEGDRLLEVQEPVTGPFDKPIRRWTVAAHLAKGLPDAPDPEVDARTRGSLRIRAGDQHFLYDRWGLRKPDPSEEIEDG
ncbi:MAG: CRISPR-associated helicase Cas3' [Myxococcota bacterium]